MSGAEAAGGAELPRARGSRLRQRQRLIDACISALHIHGPSRTTVEKVVALANLSPGIVRFYFRSKAAMLVASLQYLATEFDEQVLAPVAALRETPVAAMQRLVELYLDPELASPRKISVWYAFWGEATSRQEYYEICGQKDDSFVVLVRELVGRLVAQSGDLHLDVEALSLGFIGLLEVLWQGYAFQSEEDIDRVAGRERCMAYLRSVFPRQFGAMSTVPAPASWPQADERPTLSGFARECEEAVRGRDLLVAHAEDLREADTVLAVEFARLPMLVTRSASGVAVLLNRCPATSHELLAPGRHERVRQLCCELHGFAWDFAGRRDGDGSMDAAVHQAFGDLVRFETVEVGGVLLATPVPDRFARGELAALLSDQGQLSPAGIAVTLEVAAPWRAVVAHWRDLVSASQTHDGTARLRIVDDRVLAELRDGGLSLVSVAPSAPDHCRLEYRSFVRTSATAGDRAANFAAVRQARATLLRDRAVVEAIHRSLDSPIPPR